MSWLFKTKTIEDKLSEMNKQYSYFISIKNKLYEEYKNLLNFLENPHLVNNNNYYSTSDFKYSVKRKTDRLMTELNRTRKLYNKYLGFIEIYGTSEQEQKKEVTRLLDESMLDESIKQTLLKNYNVITIELLKECNAILEMKEYVSGFQRIIELRYKRPSAILSDEDMQAIKYAKRKLSNFFKAAPEMKYESNYPERPLAEAPAAKAPLAEAPAAEAPLAEAPLAEAPAAEAPAAEAPLAEAPLAEAPAAEAPLAEAPLAEAPAAEAPLAEDTTNATGGKSLKKTRRRLNKKTRRRLNKKTRRRKKTKHNHKKSMRSH